MEKSEFAVSPETENSHWLRGDKNAITLTTADHDLCADAFCDLYQLSSLICAVIRKGAVCFKIESCSETFQRFFAQR